MRDAGSGTGTRRHLVLLALGLIAGAALRAHGLFSESLWYDEYWTAWVIDRPFADVPRHVLVDLHPPAFFLVLKAFVAAFADPDGTPLVAMRLHAWLWGVLGLALVGAVASRAFGLRAGAFAVWFLALVPQHVWVSQDARMYPMVGALLVAGYGAAAELLRPGATGRVRWLWAAALCVLLAGAFATHYLAAMAIAWLFVAGFVLHRRQGASVATWLAGFALAAVLIAPLVWALLPNLSLARDTLEWIPPPGILDVLRALGRAWLVHWEVVPGGPVPNWLGDALPLAALGGLVWGCASVESTRRPLAWLFLGAFVFGILAAYAVSLVGVRLILWTRHGVVFLPLLAVAAGAALEVCWSRGLPVQAGVVAVSAGALATTLFAAGNTAHPNFAAAARELAREGRTALPLYVLGQRYIGHPLYPGGTLISEVPYQTGRRDGRPAEWLYSRPESDRPAQFLLLELRAPLLGPPYDHTAFREALLTSARARRIAEDTAGRVILYEVEAGEWAAFESGVQRRLNALAPADKQAGLAAYWDDTVLGGAPAYPAGRLQTTPTFRFDVTIPVYAAAGEARRAVLAARRASGPETFAIELEAAGVRTSATLPLGDSETAVSIPAGSDVRGVTLTALSDPIAAGFTFRYVLVEQTQVAMKDLPAGS